MTEPRPGRRRVLLAGVALASAVAGFALASSPAPTEATWTVSRTLNVTATAVTPVQPTALTCPGSGVLSNVPFTWTAPPGTAPSHYTLKWTGAATGSSTHPGTSGTVPSPLGTITVSVYADYGSWQSAAAVQVRHVNGIIFVGWTCGA
jgi:hypothetical protein